jgi:hypothetical protein
MPSLDPTITTLTGHDMQVMLQQQLKGSKQEPHGPHKKVARLSLAKGTGIAYAT